MKIICKKKKKDKSEGKKLAKSYSQSQPKMLLTMQEKSTLRKVMYFMLIRLKNSLYPLSHEIVLI